MAGIFGRIAQFILQNTSLDDLPAEVPARSKDMLVNAAAVGLAGAAHPEGIAVTRFAQEMRGNGKCTIIGMGLRTSPVYATLANATMVRLLDFDDEIAGRKCHPGSFIFPVVMALGEMNGNSGPEVLLAFCLGCEIVSKLSGDPASAGSHFQYRQSAGGTLGAAAAAASLMRMDRAQTEAALALAGGEGAPGPALEPSHWPANLADSGTAIQHGRAAMNGLMAALLARDGFTSPAEASAFPQGRSPGRGRMDEDSLTYRLGSPYDVIQPGVALKLYPCQLACHTAIDAALQLVEQYRLDPQQVASVHVSVAPSALEDLPFSDPKNAWEARASLEYVVASALMYGPPLLDQFTVAAVRDTRVREVMGRITVDASETSTPLIPNPCSVTVTLSGGRQLQHRVEFARGHPALPLDPEELDSKFLYCSRYILPPDHIEGAIQQFRDLENIADVTGLASILGG